MNYYERSFHRIYESFVFSLKIYPDEYHQKLLLHQILERIDTLFEHYRQLELPLYPLIQWKNHYKFKVQHYYMMKGG